jgi:hypothetical protein
MTGSNNETNLVTNLQPSHPLIKTLEQMRAIIPYCDNILTDFITQAKQGWNPNPYEFIQQISQIRTQELTKREQYSDIISCFTVVTMSGGNPLTQQIIAATKNNLLEKSRAKGFNV